jgi:zinc protease
MKRWLIICSLFWVGVVSSAYSEDNLSMNSQTIPVDSAISLGTLDNGLKYYIRENQKPENRTVLRLVVNAGSVLEDKDQQGLAHFVEHMAFNGTRDFEKQELVDYLESIGMRFGPDLNAYTSFDETVYKLQMPSDDLGVVQTGLNILKNWAHLIRLDPGEIEKERGVIIEEWRVGRGAMARMRDEQLPILFQNSRYAERLPIGKKDIIESFDYDTIERFYRDWYRPDLMAVIAVGDFEKEWMEKEIQRLFSTIPLPETRRERPHYPVPDHDETLFAIATDPEATRSSISIYYKNELQPDTTLSDYRRLIVERLYNSMLNERLSEIVKEPDPPFLFAYSAKGRLIRSREVYLLSAAIRGDRFERGLGRLMTEVERVRRHGFTSSELERMKAEFLRSMEKAYRERNKTESVTFAKEYTRHFIYGEPVPGIEFEYNAYRMLLPHVQLSDVNTVAQQWTHDDNRVVLLNAPDQEDVNVPDEDELLLVFDRVDSAIIEPYQDAVSDAPLLPSVPTAGEIVDEETYPNIDVTRWTLANGITVFFKPTDFKNDQVLFTSYSPGGYSLVSTEDHIPAVTASSVIRESGIGTFTDIELQKKLAGKVVSVSPYIHELSEGLSGQASPQDLKTLFELVHLYITTPRMDSTAFLSFQTRIKGFIENKSSDPESAFLDTIQVTMNNYHPRKRPWTPELVDEMNLQRSFQIYQDRFADMSDFAFFFVGAFSPDSLRPLVKTYLGSLPDRPGEERWQDIGVDPPTHRIEKELRRGIEPKSRVRFVFTGPFDWSQKEKLVFDAMLQAIRIRFRQVIREDMGGTYGVRVRGSVSHFPDSEFEIKVDFGCDPKRVQELSDQILSVVQEMSDQPPDSILMEKVTSSFLREYEVNLEQNKFWLQSLKSYHFHQLDMDGVLTYPDRVADLSAEELQQAVQTCFDTRSYARFVLYPKTQ